MAENAIKVRVEGEIAYIALNRPEKRNATNAEVLCRIYDAWVRLDEDDSLRVAILTGRGDAFCAGHDQEGRAAVFRRATRHEGEIERLGCARRKERARSF